jgi:hypothetical protein
VEAVTIANAKETNIVIPQTENVPAQPPAVARHEPTSESRSVSAQKNSAEVRQVAPKSLPASVVITEKAKGNMAPGPFTKLKWIFIVAVVVVGIVAGYLFSHKKVGASLDSSGAPQSSTTSTPVQGQKESARIVALDALRRGTDLSLTISKLPKLEKVVAAAKKLGEISPRYQEQITLAQKTLSTVQKDQDTSLVAYFGKVVELDRYTPDQISYAMNAVQNGDISPREKSVAELLSRHVDMLHNNPTTDPKKFLADYTGRFSSFVE